MMQAIGTGRIGTQTPTNILSSLCMLFNFLFIKTSY
jgi:hypothetical protein